MGDLVAQEHSMISYFRNAFKEVIRDCVAIKKIELQPCTIGGEFDLHSSRISICVTAVVDLSRYKFPDEGELLAVMKTLPADLRNTNPTAKISSEDDSGLITVTYGFYQTVSFLRDILDHELEKVYFERVEEAIDRSQDAQPEPFEKAVEKK